MKRSSTPLMDRRRKADRNEKLAVGAFVAMWVFWALICLAVGVGLVVLIWQAIL